VILLRFLQPIIRLYYLPTLDIFKSIRNPQILIHQSGLKPLYELLYSGLLVKYHNGVADYAAKYHLAHFS